MIVFSGLNLVIFILISLIHVYWAFGGKWGVEGVIPKLENKSGALKPPPAATLIVAGGILVFALIHAGALGLISVVTSDYLAIGLIIIAIIFALRTLGDFKYVGLFKKKRAGLFAKNDTRYYVPLCVLISLNASMSYYLL
jgi:hypothetical protein